MASFRAVDWVLLDHTADEPVRVGDLVSADAGGMPIYWVEAVVEGGALLGDEARRTTQAMSLDKFRWKGARA